MRSSIEEKPNTNIHCGWHADKQYVCTRRLQRNAHIEPPSAVRHWQHKMMLMFFSNASLATSFSPNLMGRFSQKKLPQPTIGKFPMAVWVLRATCNVYVARTDERRYDNRTQALMSATLFAYIRLGWAECLTSEPELLRCLASVPTAVHPVRTHTILAFTTTQAIAEDLVWSRLQ